MHVLARQARTKYAVEVQTILNTDSHDVERIAHLLDGLLDFCFDPGMVELFRKLCRHYYAIDPAAAASYVQTYRTLWDSE